MLTNRMHSAALTPLHTLSHELDRMFGGFLDAPRRTATSYPAVSIWEDEDAFHIEAEVAGVAPEDLDIQVIVNRVTLRGERKQQRAADNPTVHREEWRPLEFERSFELPVDIDGDSVQADLNQGILGLTLPKTPKHKPVKVNVAVHTTNPE